jgi:hypothetical protein
LRNILTIPVRCLLRCEKLELTIEMKNMKID